MLPWSSPLRGRIDEHVFESRLLANNPLGDPHARPLMVYTPPGYDEDTSRQYPSIYILQGWTGQLDMWRNRSPLRRNAIELADEMFARATPAVPPCILVYVDAWTSLCGSQFVDSPAVGTYHSYLCDEIVPFVDAKYRTKASRDHRGVAGKSSGGYGAMITPMLRPDLFGGFATHAGDALFEYCYLPMFPQALRALRDEYQGSYEKFFTSFKSRTPFTKGSDFPLLSDWSMSACYSANDDGKVELPYDIATGRIREEIWARWLAKDPVRMAPKHAEALRSMRAIYIDCGKRDEYNLDLGAAAFKQALADLGVTDIFFELFDGTHMSIEYRYPIALEYLAKRLA
jgi:S-formylglutathione hydrolase FrmB